MKPPEVKASNKSSKTGLRSAKRPTNVPAKAARAVTNCALMACHFLYLYWSVKTKSQWNSTYERPLETKILKSPISCGIS